MGNRANYGFRSGHNTVFLYGHWAGEPGMSHRLASALREATPRWTDSGYATRIAISQLIGDDWNSETGWGIYVNEICDNENPVFIVDWDMQAVKLCDADDITGSSPLQTWDLPTFVDTYFMGVAA